MRSRRLLTWIVFAVCVLLVVDGLGWLTWQALRLERREAASRAEAAQRESVRLALWRLDSAVAPILAREAARPYFHYRPAFDASRPYEEVWFTEDPGAELVPSPLKRLDRGALSVRLHFQIEPDGRIVTPEGEVGGESAEAALMREAAARYALTGPDAAPSPLALGAAEPEGVAFEFAARQGLAERLRSPDASGVLGVTADHAEEASDTLAARPLAMPESLSRRAAGPPEAEGEPGASRDARARSRQDVEGARALTLLDPGGDAPRDPGVRVGELRPVWVPAGDDPELMLVREVFVRGGRYVQAAWLDWEGLSATLLGAVADLLEGAALTPVTDQAEAGGPGSMMATVPVRLEAGVREAALPGRTPVRIGLVVAWVAVLAAIVAIGAVLHASMVLSERRGRFVSAVTHELRTPLTTFCMYTQMLAGGMVRDEQTRERYLETLRRESQRLAAIVENVLDYARLGRRSEARTEPVAVGALVERVRPALEARCEAAGVRLEVEVAPGASGVQALADAGRVERVLYNLVDNACRYGVQDGAGPVRLEAGVGEGGAIELCVSDDGPGVAPAERERIFGEFRRGSRAGAVRGIGLGLALSRSLAREMGGDLRLLSRRASGAEFVLTLRSAARAAGS